MQKETITLSGAVSSWLGSNSEQNKPRETIYSLRLQISRTSVEHNNIAETLP